MNTFKEQRERLKKSEKILKDVWDHIKCTKNVCVIRDQKERRQREKKLKKYWPTSQM